MTKVRSSLKDGVLTVTLADEANRNALSHQLVTELSVTLDRADRDPEVRVVVLTNTGPVFCAGADLRERSGRSPDRPARRAERKQPRDQRPLTSPVRDLFGRFRRSPKPYVGRIAGHCVAGGMGLAAATDISIAMAEARFGFTEVRIGVAPAMLSVLCLPKMPRAQATAAFLRGNRFPAAEAAAMGLITEAVAAHRLDETVDAIVTDLMAGSPTGLAAAKQLLGRVPEMGFDEALDWTEKFSAELFSSEDAAEGMAAYLEKRPPRWAR